MVSCVRSCFHWLLWARPVNLEQPALTHHPWDSHTNVTNWLFPLQGQSGVCACVCDVFGVVYAFETGFHVFQAILELYVTKDNLELLILLLSP